MAKVRVAVLGTVGKTVQFDSEATVGSTIGVDFKLPDGSIATKDTLATFLGVPAAGSGGVTQHRLLLGLNVGNDHPQYTRKDTLTTRGDLYVRDSTTVARITLGSAGQLLRSDGMDPLWETLSPVITLSTDLSGNTTLTNLGNGTLAATIVSHAVTNGKIRQSSALSVVGNSTNATADVADILASSDTTVLRRSGTVIGFGTIDHTYVSDFGEAAQDAVGSSLTNTARITFTYDDAGNTISADIAANSVDNGYIRQSGGLSVIGRSTNTTGNIADITAGSDGDVLRRSGTTLGFGSIPESSVTNLVADLASKATTTWTLTAGTGLTGGGDLSANRTVSINTNGVSDSLIRQSAGLSVIGRSANTTGNVADITAGSDDTLLRRSGTSIAFGQLTVGMFPDTVVTYAKIQNVSATNRILGRITAGAGSIEELTGTQTTTLLDAFTSALKGLAPASGGGTTNFLRADGTWAAPGGGGGTPGGSDTQVQYNNSGAFAGSAAFTWTDSTHVMVLGDTTTSPTVQALDRSTSGAGVAFLVIAGAGNTSGNGGKLTLKGGAGGATSGQGGGVDLLGGIPTNGNGGTVNVQGANGVTTSTGAGGGSANLTGGNGHLAGSGGSANVTGGTAGATGGANGVNISGGSGGATSGNGGTITITAGAAPTSGVGGSVSLTAGASNGSAKNGGSINLTPTVASDSSGTSGTIKFAKWQSDTSYDYQVLTTGFSYTVQDMCGMLIIDPAGTLATGTVTMPAKPNDGQIVRISSTQAITGLTVSANTGQSIKDAPTTLTAGGKFGYIYRLSNTTWYVYS